MTPVFIVGEARSGTSILYRSIQAHPAFLPTMGLNLAESHAMDHLPKLLEKADVRPGPLSEFLMSLDALGAVAEDIESLKGRRRLATRITGNHAARLPAWSASGDHHVVRRYFLEAARSRGAKRLIEKTPQHLPWVPHLALAFPNARFLYMTRHPVDVLSSYRKRFSLDPNGSAWANITVDAFCERWAASTRLALSIAETDERMLIIAYEAFTAQTEQQVRRVLAHLDEPFDEACLLHESNEVGVWPIDPHLFGSIIQETKRWEDFVDRSTASQVERRLAPAMALLGYEPGRHGESGHG